jgi:peptidoglycan hydrolase-like protein with peptidoglycan-binding domain
MFDLGGAIGNLGGLVNGIAGGVGSAVAGGGGGAIGNAIQAAMNDALTITRELSVGSKGKDVAAVQQRLNEYIGAKLTADGAFGPKTDAAVRQAQKMFLLKVDGIVGVMTATALGFPYSGPKHGALAAAAAAGGAAAAGAAGGGGPDAQAIIMALNQALGQTLKGLLPGGAVEGVMQDVLGKVLPAVQNVAGGLPFGSIGGGMANPDALGAVNSELAIVKAKVNNLGANTPTVNGLFSEAGQMLGSFASQVGGAFGGIGL